MEKEGRESWKVYKVDMLGLKRVLENGFEAFSNAKLMKMSFRGVWDTSRGLKPSKMAEKCDFAQKKCFLPGKKILISFNKRLIPK